MGSVQGFQKCPTCGGVMVVNTYYRSGEEYAHCQRCGSGETNTLKRNENNEIMKDEQDRHLFNHVKNVGFGVYGIFSLNGVGQIGSFNEPITEEVISDLRKTIEENDDVDKERSYLAKWEEGKQTILLGKDLQDTVTMNYEDLIEKWEKESEEYNKAPAKGLEHFTRDELTDAINDFLREKINYVDEDFEIKSIWLVGSRIKGTHREDSDLDVAFEYDGNYRSDSMCDTLNGEPLMFDNIKVDFIPYSLYKGDQVRKDETMEHVSVVTHLGECDMEDIF